MSNLTSAVWQTDNEQVMAFINEAGYLNIYVTQDETEWKRVLNTHVDGAAVDSLIDMLLEHQISQDEQGLLLPLETGLQGVNGEVGLIGDVGVSLETCPNCQAQTFDGFECASCRYLDSSDIPF